MFARRLAEAAVLVAICLPLGAHADRQFSWQEEVALADGSAVFVRRDVTRQSLCHSSLPGSCQILSSTLTATIPGVGKLRFDWKGSGWPVAFDVVAGRAWIVMPIAGLEACEKYGNPAESVAAFAWDGRQWEHKAYREAPRVLKSNLVRSIPLNDASRITLDEKRRSYDHGVELDKRFIPQHVKWGSSCARLNPPAAPEYERALREFSDTRWVALNGKLGEARTEPVSLTLAEDRAHFGMPGDQHGIVGCSGKVSHKHSIFSTRRLEGGGSHGTLTAYRIALAPGGDGAPAIFLPAKGPTPRSHIARVACTEALIYVVLRQEREVLGVLAYDGQGNRKNAWRIHMPDLPVPEKNWGRVIEFADLGDRFRLVIGEYQHHGGTRGAVVATLGPRYLVEAPK